MYPSVERYKQRKTGIDPALSILQGEVLTTQLSIVRLQRNRLSGMTRCFYLRISLCLARYLTS